MKKITIILFTTFFFSVIVKGQSAKDSIENIEEAAYLAGDLTKLLKQYTEYPIGALKKSIKGDVLVSFLIDSNGKMDSITIISSPSKTLSVSSLVSLDQLENKWSPHKVNNTPVSKTYNIVYRYRFYMDSDMPDYEKKANQFIAKKKYDKALKIFNKAIKDNQFNYKLYESRANVKEKLGDSKGALSDSEHALRLKNEVIALIEINTIGKSRERRVIGHREERQRL